MPLKGEALRAIGTHCRALVNLYCVWGASPHFAAIVQIDDAHQLRRQRAQRSQFKDSR